jgi:hypothetical protein
MGSDNESQDEKRHEEDIKHHPHGKEAERENDDKRKDD